MSAWWQTQAERLSDTALGAAIVTGGVGIYKAWTSLRAGRDRLAAQRAREQEEAEERLLDRLQRRIDTLEGRLEKAEARCEALKTQADHWQGAYEAEHRRAEDLGEQLLRSELLTEERMRELEALRQEVAALRQRVGE